MPRKPRFVLPGVPQHIIQRGNNRASCFMVEQDYRRYLEYLQNAAGKYACRIHAYVLMTNHVHLLVTPEMEYGIAGMMQALGRRYVQYINTTYHRTGSLWEGRYKASLVESEAYLLSCMRYIELNPIRAGMVQRAGDYPWSSYGGNALGCDDPLLSPHPVYAALGDGVADRQRAYQELFRHHMDAAHVQEIRDSLHHELVLGSSGFRDRIEAVTQRQTRLGISGRPRAEDETGVY